MMFKKLEEFLEKITKNNNNHTSRDEFLDEMGGCLPEDLEKVLNDHDFSREEEVPVGVLLPEEVMLELEKHSEEDH